MKCPYCYSTFAGKPQYCPNCRQPLSRADSAFRKDANSEGEETAAVKKRNIPIAPILRALFAVSCVLIAVIGMYKLYYWIANYRIDRLYTRGDLTPTISEVTMDDGRVGHSFVFYGTDGDQIYIPELDKSLVITGGSARVNVADADWFEGDVTDIDGADIVLTPVLITEKGTRTQLPSMKLTIETPYAPLTVTSPEVNGSTTLVSRYDLALSVVPGSTVYLNGEDVTSKVDRGGDLTQTVVVQPIGTNTYSVVVRTARHKETRYDIEIYRENYPISVTLDSTVGTSSRNDTFTVSGTTDPDASIMVETDYVEDSLSIDETGHFAFIAKLNNYGDNVIRFRIQKEGLPDDVLSMTVYYSPQLATYSAKAWAMDYDQLSQLYAQWTGKVFLCKGRIVDKLTDNGKTYLVMNVNSEGEQQYIILENRSSLTDISIGSRYSCYADVTGRMMYNTEYYPLLCARFIDTMA